MTKSLSLFLLVLGLGACRGFGSETSTISGASKGTDDSGTHDTGSIETMTADSTWLPAQTPQEPVRIVFVGDSITAGFGAPDGLDYAALLESNDVTAWPQFIDDDLPSLFGGPLQVENVAAPGSTTQSVLELQLSTLQERLGEPPWAGETVVMMTAGGNDLQFAIPRLLEEGDAATEDVLGAMDANLDAILAWFDDPAHFPDGARVYLTNVYEPTDGTGYVATCLGGIDIKPLMPVLAEANKRFLSTAIDHDAGLLDLRHAFLGHAFYSDDPAHFAYDEDDPTLWMAPDCIHPNERGHHELRMLFINALAGTLPQ